MREAAGIKRVAGRIPCTGGRRRKVIGLEVFRSDGRKGHDLVLRRGLVSDTHQTMSQPGAERAGGD